VFLIVQASFPYVKTDLVKVLKILSIVWLCTNDDLDTCFFAPVACINFDISDGMFLWLTYDAMQPVQLKVLICNNILFLMHVLLLIVTC
jgi:hypothetical protein